jgi:hypothetical protein
MTTLIAFLDIARADQNVLQKDLRAISAQDNIQNREQESQLGTISHFKEPLQTIWKRSTGGLTAVFSRKFRVLLSTPTPSLMDMKTTADKGRT